ncbi:MAG: cysteine hydrolase [Clostridia bacterium]|nr:cysteine hydrolase [Clostridia bacterium]
MKGNRKVLLVIDMQNDFINGTLGTKEAEAIVDKVNQKITTYRNAEDIIIFTRDTHDENYLDTMEGKKLPVLHCKKNTEGWQITSRIQVYDEDKIIDKPTFGSLELANYMEEFDVSAIEIIGLCTDICVISNAMIMKAKFPDINISVDSSCCAGVTPESHKNALKAMEMCHIEVK